MDWLLNLIPGGGLTAVIGAVLAGIAALGTLLWKSKKAGRDEQKVDEYERHLQELEHVKRAARARPVGGVLDDPDNRDNDKP